jgi:hypothetical protein
MSSPNLNLRDPVIYRILHQEHPKTGDKWKIYPSYDLLTDNRTPLKASPIPFVRLNLSITAHFMIGFVKTLASIIPNRLNLPALT